MKGMLSCLHKIMMNELSMPEVTDVITNER